MLLGNDEPSPTASRCKGCRSSSDAHRSAVSEAIGGTLRPFRLRLQPPGDRGRRQPAIMRSWWQKTVLSQSNARARAASIDFPPAAPLIPRLAFDALEGGCRVDELHRQTPTTKNLVSFCPSWRALGNTPIWRGATSDRRCQSPVSGDSSTVIKIFLGVTHGL